MSALWRASRFIDGKVIQRDLLLQKRSAALTHTQLNALHLPPPTFFYTTCLSFTLNPTVTVEAVLLLC